VTAQVVNLTSQPFPLYLRESYFSIVFSWLSREVDNRPKLESDEVRIRKLIDKAVRAPVALVQKETLAEVFVTRDAFTTEMVKRILVFLLGLAGIAGAVFGGIQLLNS